MNAAATSRVLLIDDHPIYRIGLHGALAGLRAGVQVHEAGTVLEALDLLALQPRFDLIIYDWRLGNDLGGRRGLLAVTQGAPGVPVLVLSGVDDEDARLAAESSGAVDYVLKTAEPRHLCDVIRRWLQREHQPQPAARDGQPPPRSAAPTLTVRQHQVLRGMAQGSQNKTIADSLKIKETTVRGHVSDILRLMNANNRTRAVVLAVRWGLV